MWTPWPDTRRLAQVPHRQAVLTIPKRLRAHCPYWRRLHGEIARGAARTVMAAIRILTGERGLTVGLVACLQRPARMRTGIRSCTCYHKRAYPSTVVNAAGSLLDPCPAYRVSYQ